jgi:hypothetical protein
MVFTLSNVVAADIDLLVRKVEYPANLQNPLYLTMFPVSNTDKQEEHREEEIRWMLDGLTEALAGQRENLWKASKPDGTPVGLVGWLVGQATGTCKMNGEQSEARKSCAGRGQVKAFGKQERSNGWCPSTMDVISWLRVSEKLKEERERVLQNYGSKDICRESTLLSTSTPLMSQ